MTKARSRRLLFVCTGNTCRSPLARFLAERLAREAGLPWTAASAGVAAINGSPLSPGAVHALAARGIKGVKHASRQVTAEDLAAADQVYALAEEHRAVLAERFPDAAKKIAVLRAAAGLAETDVEDPIGEDQAVYDQCAARIEEALRILIRRNPHAENAR